MVSLLGILLLPGIAFLLSSARRNINWRTVGGAFAIQALIGAFILYFEPGIQLLLSMTDFVGNIIGYSQEGINFVFGVVGDKSLGFIFAFNVLPVIIFFSSLIAVLYYLGVMAGSSNSLAASYKRSWVPVVLSPCPPLPTFLSARPKPLW